MSKEGAFIGDVSRRTGLSVHAIRFYEGEGLVREMVRTHSGYRVFPPHAVERLQFIRKTQALGFTLDEIRELLLLRDRSADACSHVKSLVEEKVASVRGKIRELEAMQKDLKRVLADCNRQVKRHRPRDRGRCPVLAKLGRKE